jgi:hypothetical protein
MVRVKWTAGAGAADAGAVAGPALVATDAAVGGVALAAAGAVAWLEPVGALQAASSDTSDRDNRVRDEGFKRVLRRRCPMAASRR